MDSLLDIVIIVLVLINVNASLSGTSFCPSFCDLLRECFRHSGTGPLLHNSKLHAVSTLEAPEEESPSGPSYPD